MNKALLVDRGALIQLATSKGPSSIAVEARIRDYDIIAIETGGASALRNALARKPVGEKLYVVGRDDYQRANDLGADGLPDLLVKVSADHGVQHELRRYAASRSPLVEEKEAILKYVLKLFFLANILKADILFAPYRIDLFTSIMEALGARPSKVQRDGFLHSDIGAQGENSAISGLCSPPISAFAMNGITQTSDPLEKVMKQGHVFLSYCHDNTAQVQQLHDELMLRGMEVWWDKNIKPGQDWKFEISKALREARAVILCLSAEAVGREKSGLFPEALDAIGKYREYQPGSIYIIPVRLSKCAIPMIAIDGTRTLDALQYIDLFPESVWQDSIDNICQALK